MDVLWKKHWETEDIEYCNGFILDAIQLIPCSSNSNLFFLLNSCKNTYNLEIYLQHGIVSYRKIAKYVLECHELQNLWDIKDYHYSNLTLNLNLKTGLSDSNTNHSSIVGYVLNNTTLICYLSSSLHTVIDSYNLCFMEEENGNIIVAETNTNPTKEALPINLLQLFYLQHSKAMYAMVELNAGQVVLLEITTQSYTLLWKSEIETLTTHYLYACHNQLDTLYFVDVHQEELQLDNVVISLYVWNKDIGIKKIWTQLIEHVSIKKYGFRVLLKMETDCIVYLIYNFPMVTTSSSSCTTTTTTNSGIYRMIMNEHYDIRQFAFKRFDNPECCVFGNVEYHEDWIYVSCLGEQNNNQMIVLDKTTLTLRDHIPLTFQTPLIYFMKMENEFIGITENYICCFVDNYYWKQKCQQLYLGRTSSLQHIYINEPIKQSFLYATHPVEIKRDKIGFGFSLTTTLPSPVCITITSLLFQNQTESTISSSLTTHEIDYIYLFYIDNAPLNLTTTFPIQIMSHIPIPANCHSGPPNLQFPIVNGIIMNMNLINQCDFPSTMTISGWNYRISQSGYYVIWFETFQPSFLYQNSLLLTKENGYQRIDELGDTALILTVDQRPIQVKIKQHCYPTNHTFYPYILEQNLLGKGLPFQPLLVGKNQLIFDYKTKRFTKGSDLGGKKISSYDTITTSTTFFYYEIIVPNEKRDFIMVNGLVLKCSNSGSNSGSNSND